ncbi:hypothetical protein NDU88_001858 [Pleurodeles waltl]|uniref:Reverse transcriptase domain-containing protein n=1 Tax=Pleurodeles waltl TaxID=8319 RepID=A0AAV7VBL3_PLEWA|nr:hypothetical protein NDU88_001858 [Pleurodeles waltl]
MLYHLVDSPLLGRAGAVVAAVDMEKAFDTMNWIFLQVVLEEMEIVIPDTDETSGTGVSAARAASAGRDRIGRSPKMAAGLTASRRARGPGPAR